MSVIDFQEAIRARLSQMCDEHLAMQEALHSMAPSQIEEHCKMMTRHSDKMSRLAARLHEEPSPFPFPEGEGEEGPEAA